MVTVVIYNLALEKRTCGNWTNYRRVVSVVVYNLAVEKRTFTDRLYIANSRPLQFSVGMFQKRTILSSGYANGEK